MFILCHDLGVNVFFLRFFVYIIQSVDLYRSNNAGLHSEVFVHTHQMCIDHGKFYIPFLLL
jgi:hypothetical protein